MPTRPAMPSGSATPLNTCMTCDGRTLGGLFCHRCNRCSADDLPDGYVIGHEAKPGGGTLHCPRRTGYGQHVGHQPGEGAQHRMTAYTSERAAILACRADLGRRRREARAAATYGV